MVTGGGVGYVTVQEGDKGYNGRKCLDNIVLENPRAEL